MRSSGLHKRQNHKTNRREQRYRRCSLCSLQDSFYCCYSKKIVAVIGGVRLNGSRGKLRPSKILTLKPISCEKGSALCRAKPQICPIKLLLFATRRSIYQPGFPLPYSLPSTGPERGPGKGVIIVLCVLNTS